VNQLNQQAAVLNAEIQRDLVEFDPSQRRRERGTPVYSANRSANRTSYPRSHQASHYFPRYSPRRSSPRSPPTPSPTQESPVDATLSTGNQPSQGVRYKKQFSGESTPSSEISLTYLPTTPIPQISIAGAAARAQASTQPSLDARISLQTPVLETRIQIPAQGNPWSVEDSRSSPPSPPSPQTQTQAPHSPPYIPRGIPGYSTPRLSHYSDFRRQRYKSRR